MSEQKEQPELIDALSPEQLVGLAALFEPLVQSEGWKSYTAWIEHHRVGIGLYGHSDDTKRPGYYQGFLEAMEELTRFPIDVVEKVKKAREAAEAERRARETRERTRQEFTGRNIDIGNVRVGAFGQGDPDEVGG